MYKTNSQRVKHTRVQQRSGCCWRCVHESVASSGERSDGAARGHSREMVLPAAASVIASNSVLSPTRHTPAIQLLQPFRPTFFALSTSFLLPIYVSVAFMCSSLTRGLRARFASFSFSCGNALVFPSAGTKAALCQIAHGNRRLTAPHLPEEPLNSLAAANVL